MSPTTSSNKNPIDIELIAQRILKLAEISTLEHLESLVRSQADGLLKLADLAAPDCGFDGRLW